MISHSGRFGSSTATRSPRDTPSGEERAGDVVDARAQRRIGQALAAEDDGLGVGPGPRHVVEESAERAARSEAMAQRPVKRGGRPSRCAAMPSSTSRLHSSAWRSVSDSARASPKPP